MKLHLLEQVLALAADGTTAVLITDIENGRQALLCAGGQWGDLLLDDAVRAVAAEALADGRSHLYVTPARRLLMRVYSPPLRLLIVGAVHIAVPLSRIATICGYAVTVIDPRRRFAGRESFPGCCVIDDWPDLALPSLGPDRHTAIVSLTHDPKLDDAALRQALTTPAFYIGALGSRRSHQARLARLAADGVDEAELARIHGPVGLDIGALSPAEIAIAIVAEMIATLRCSRWPRDEARSRSPGG
jgi:xanthine dehydrogenase accessory factor